MADDIEINVQAVKTLIDSNGDFLLLDCRNPDEYQTARIDKSMLIPMNDLPGRVQELEEYREKHIVVHCHHGGRSLMVTEWLRGQGFANVQNMTGGIDAWSQVVDQEVPRY